MKTGTKVVLGIALSFSLLGIFFGVFGYYTGGIDDIRAKAEATTQKYTKTFDNLDSLTVSGENYLIVTSGNVTKPTLTYTKVKAQNSIYTTDYSFKNGELSLTSKASYATSRHISGGLLDLAREGFSFDNQITLTLPKNSNLKTISVSNISGFILKNLRLKDTTIETSSYFETTNVNLDSTKLSVNYNTIDMKQTTLINTNITIQDGDFEGNGLTFKQKNSIIADGIDISLNDYNLTVTHNAEEDDDITKRLTASSENTLNLVARDDDITVQ
ncbi:DUF4097 family beta strand repeat-containing protein [Streptococcus hyointestinalis]|uniref:DUF4097 family beta strand repeat-containing protein n=1 Tax=Streptococcus hyointestinalis TaxID=1337 RepID=UPI0035144370